MNLTQPIHAGIEALFLKRPENMIKGIHMRGKTLTMPYKVSKIDPKSIPTDVPVKNITTSIRYIEKNCSAVFPRPIIQ